MPIVFHELKRNRISLSIWSGVIAFMLGVCILIYPEMSSQMGQMSEMFADMGAFSEAFGMDKLNFGEFMGYFAIECGNVLGLGGAFFAAIIGVSALSKEEKEHTAEYLLTHPISRVSIVFQKLITILLQILILNLVTIVTTSVCVSIVNVDVNVGKMVLLFAAYLIMQIEVAAISFEMSAFMKGSGIGVGLGVAVGFYFMNLVANLSKYIVFLKYITPFGYTDGSEIVSNGTLETKYLMIGLLFTVCGIVTAFYWYKRKDIS